MRRAGEALYKNPVGSSEVSFPELNWSLECKDSAEKKGHLLQSEGTFGKWEPFLQVSFPSCKIEKLSIKGRFL